MATTVLHETSKMRLELEVQNNVALFRPMGVIDEDAQLHLIFQTLTPMRPLLQGIRFDLAHVKRMNSCGIREWILLMERVAPLAPVTFENLSEAFVEQANMLPGVFGKKAAPAILSFQVPYHCPSCGKDVSFRVLLQDLPMSDGKPVAPGKSCPDCGGTLDFDWVGEEYFSFLNLVGA